MIKKLNCLLVGGAVRDHLLGIQSRDRDYVVVGSSPEEMIANGFSKVGASFPVFLHPETGEEYALARTERKTGVGYHGFDTTYDSSVTLEDDLMRRDLTINAMAMTDNLQIIDPFNGIKDLQDRVLRHTSEAFADDPLRVLRLARFAARYDFAVAPETMQLAIKIVRSDELSSLPRERFWAELYKGFSEKVPSKMLKVLADVGALGAHPLYEYFGPFDYVQTKSLLKSAASMPTKVNLTDANVLLSMTPLSHSTDSELNALKVPNHIKDAARLVYNLTSVLSDNVQAEEMHHLLNVTRFVVDAKTEQMKLALFVSFVQATYNGDAERWKSNFTKMKKAAASVKRLNMEKIVASGDMKTVKARVDAAKFAAVKRSFK